jgi:hypothetical protein
MKENTEALKSKAYRLSKNISVSKYDMTMCNNRHCEKRFSCNRFFMYRVYKADVRPSKPSCLIMYKGDEEDCDLYWKMNEE